MTTDQQEFIARCKAYLDQKWEEVAAAFEQGKAEGPLGERHPLAPSFETV